MAKTPKKPVKAVKAAMSEKAKTPKYTRPKGTKEQEKTYDEHWEKIDKAIEMCIKRLKQLPNEKAGFETIRRLAEAYRTYLGDNHKAPVWNF